VSFVVTNCPKSKKKGTYMPPTYSGLKTIAAAGTALQLGSGLINGPIMIKALTTNTGLMFVGNVNGDVAVTNGYPLAAGDTVILYNIGNLENIWIDSAVNGESVAWLALDI
jgi:hypothetical protein